MRVILRSDYLLNSDRKSKVDVTVSAWTFHGSLVHELEDARIVAMTASMKRRTLVHY